MRNDILQLDEKAADDFWRLRIELFEELGEVCKGMDIFRTEISNQAILFVTHK